MLSHRTRSPKPPRDAKTSGEASPVQNRSGPVQTLQLDSQPEGPLAQLKVEESAVGEAQGGAGGLGEVGGQHGHGAVPPAGAAAELPDVVEVCSCKQAHSDAHRR